MAIDPVCGMEVDEAIAEHKMEYERETYYFCAPGCKTTFEGNPEKFIKGKAKAEMPAEEEKKPWWKFW